MNPNPDPVQAMQQALLESAARLETITAALQEVIGLFEAGALTGPNGERWSKQLQDKILPFVSDLRQTILEIERAAPSHVPPQ